jgi:transposase-like protein
MKELQEELVQLQSSVIAQNVSLVFAFAVSLLGVKSRPDSG